MTNKVDWVDVVGLGACNIDFIMKVPRFVSSDDEVDVEKLIVSLGGSASNFVVGLSRLKIKTGIIARVGKDYFGKWSIQKFKNEDVDTQRLSMINGSTGMVFIAVEPHGEKSMYTFMGANEKFRLEKEDIEYIRSSQILHITGMYKEIVEEASKYANMLSLDPGTILSSFGMDDLLQILKRTHMIFLNKKEVSLLTKENVDEGAQILLDLGIPMVVVTLGRDGANLYTDEGMIHADAREVEALDATGAGDAFAAGFIASFVKGQELEDCLSFANLVASCCVEKLGAMNSPKISALNFSLNSKKI